MRYFKRITISHSWWFYELVPGSQYLIFVYFMSYFTGFTISHSWRFYEILPGSQNLIFAYFMDISLFSKYLIVKDFWDTTRITISHICIFHEIFHCSTLSHSWRFYEILPGSQYLIFVYSMRYSTRFTISRSWIFYEILPGSQYLIFAYFMRYFTIFKISHNLRFLRYYQDQNISYLYISWDISPVSQYLMVEDFIS